jgi:hypothetical protein
MMADPAKRGALKPPMANGSYAGLKEKDLKDLIACLRTVPPLDQAVCLSPQSKRLAIRSTKRDKRKSLSLWTWIFADLHPRHGGGLFRT